MARKKKKKAPSAGGDGGGNNGGDGERPGTPMPDQNAQPEVSKEEAGRLFGEALNVMQSAEEVMVDLKGTRIGDKRAKSIAKALEQGAPHLTLLDLSNNTISDAGAAVLVAALKEGKAPKLSLLNLRGNALSKEAREEIRDKLGHRKELMLEMTDPEVTTRPSHHLGGALRIPAAAALAGRRVTCAVAFTLWCLFERSRRKRRRALLTRRTMPFRDRCPQERGSVAQPSPSSTSSRA